MILFYTQIVNMINGSLFNLVLYPTFLENVIEIRNT